MPDLTEQELRELDLWVAEVAGIRFLEYIDDSSPYPCIWPPAEDLLMLQHSDSYMDQTPWRPHASFDQAWEHLYRVLLKADRWVECKVVGATDQELWLVVVRDGENERRWVKQRKTLALAFCLAAKAALTEKDDG